MEKNQFHIKIKNFTWKNYILIIRENDFQLKKEKSKSKDLNTYSLMNAVVFDVTEKNDLRIMVSTSLYRIFIKPLSIEDKKLILSKLEEIVHKFAAKTAFSPDYFQYLKQISKTEEKNPYDALLFKLNTFQILMGEINLKLSKFKNTIKEKLSGNLTGEFMGLYNDIFSIISEMKKQFDKIITGVNKYFLVRNDKLISDGDSSSSESDNENEGVEGIVEKKDNKNHKINFDFLSNELLDYYDPNYEFKERVKLNKNIKCPENIIKEMITTFTKKQSSPVYFNEPISMCQKQCEKFFYLDLLTKASKIENNKPLQMCYIAAFIIGEIFTNLSRFLKPFSPILGETFEYFINCKKFRYYSENVKHSPQITAFIGETPDFAYYGDTSNDTSFKFLKGSLDLNFKNKIHIFFKHSKYHYVYNRPIVSVKGLIKPPMYSDYSGTTIIQDMNDQNIKLELNFIEQTWSQSILGNFEGKAYSGEDQVEYLIEGNWEEEIYITDKDGNNKEVLLSLNKDSSYLKNNLEKYCLPFYSCNLNNLNKNLESTLPPNDSRFRKDIRLLEIGDDLKKAQMYKRVYEEKQRKEIKDEEHKILFFEEKIDVETDENYYIPNGKYWEMKKNNTLKKNINWNIFEVTEYIKIEEEKERELEKEKQEKIEKEKQEKIEKEKEKDKDKEKDKEKDNEKEKEKDYEKDKEKDNEKKNEKEEKKNEKEEKNNEKEEKNNEKDEKNNEEKDRPKIEKEEKTNKKEEKEIKEEEKEKGKKSKEIENKEIKKEEKKKANNGKSIWDESNDIEENDIEIRENNIKEKKNNNKEENDINT